MFQGVMIRLFIHLNFWGGGPVKMVGIRVTHIVFGPNQLGHSSLEVDPGEYGHEKVRAILES